MAAASSSGVLQPRVASTGVLVTVAQVAQGA